MCGLVSVISKNTNGFINEQLGVFSTLLFLDQLRGEDSTGIFSVTNRGEVFLAKEASDATEFLKTNEFEKMMRQAFSSGAALVGHNRKATRGRVVDENAHPFVVDDRIVLVHNGGVFGDHKKLADVEVDSHAIAHTIHKYDGDVQRAMNEIDAAYALIWYDFDNGQLRFLRNKERPLWWMETDNAYIWCSEKAMLDFVAARHKLKLKEAPTELPEDVLQTFTLRGQNKGWPAWEASHETLNIEKKTYVYQGKGVQQQWPVCGYENDPVLEDVPFEMHPLERAQRAASPKNNLPAVIAPPSKINVERLEEALKLRKLRENTAGTTMEYERGMMETLGKGVEHQLFKQIFQQAYPYGSKALAKPFSWVYANMINDKGGFYMYSSVVNDSDVVIRHYWEERYMEEGRLDHICSHDDYVYQFLLGTHRWIPFNFRGMDASYKPSELGGFIVISDKATLVYGGGTGDTKYKPENVVKTAAEESKTIIH